MKHERSELMKNKFILNIKSLFKSIFNSKELFNRRKNSFLVPLIIFLLTIFMTAFPTYFTSINKNSSEIIKNFPGIYKPMETLLTSSLDCKIEKEVLTCTENSIKVNQVVEFYDEATQRTYKYTIIANEPNISSDISVTYSPVKDTDNLIILLNNYIKIRYVERDYVNQNVKTYEILGDYSEFEGYDFKTISDKLLSSPELVNEEVTNFIYKTYLSTLDTQLLVGIASALLSFLVFILVSSFILKSTTLFKKKKGFKYRECLKISLTSALPALLIASCGALLFKADFTSIYALIYIGRVLYIYFRYLYSNKNNIYKDLYLETNDERFKI